MFKKEFWEVAFERAFRSFFQGLIVGFTGAQFIQAIDWKAALGSGFLMFLTSICTSLAATPSGVKES